MRQRERVRSRLCSPPQGPGHLTRVHRPQNPKKERPSRALQPKDQRLLRGLPRRTPLDRASPLQPHTRRLACLLEPRVPSPQPRPPIPAILPPKTSTPGRKVLGSRHPLDKTGSLCSKLEPVLRSSAESFGARDSSFEVRIHGHRDGRGVCL